MFDIISWVTPAIRKIMCLPLDHLTPLDVAHLGPLYQKIVHAKHVLDTEKREVAFYPLGLDAPPHFGCPSVLHQTCKAAWSLTWKSCVPQAILHPTSAVPLRSLVALFDNPAYFQWPGANILRPECKQRMIEWVKGAGLDMAEERIIDGLATSVCRYIRDES